MNPEVPKSELPPEDITPEQVNVGAGLADFREAARSFAEMEERGGIANPEELRILEDRLKKGTSLALYLATHGTAEQREEFSAIVEPFLYEALAAEMTHSDDLILHVQRHPDQLELIFKISKTLREAGPEITKFEAMVAAFETAHPLAELEAIVNLSPELVTVFKYANDIASDEQVAKTIAEYEKYNPPYVDTYKEIVAKARAIVLTPEERRSFEIRKAAQADMIPIVALFNTLKRETNISTERHEELGRKLTQLTRAIGSINKLIDPSKITH